jgi:hypothetical protein
MRAPLRAVSCAVLLCLSLFAAPRSSVAGVDPSLADAAARIAMRATGQSALQTAAELASDAYHGRRSGTPGGDAAAAYVRDQFVAAGLTNVREEPFLFQFFGVDDLVLSAPSAGITANRANVAFGSGRTPRGRYLLVFAGAGGPLAMGQASIAAAGQPWVALVRRGDYQFADVALWAQEKGASGVVIYNRPAAAGEAFGPDDPFTGYVVGTLATQPHPSTALSIGVVMVPRNVGLAALVAMGMQEMGGDGAYNVGVGTNRAYVDMSVQAVYEARVGYNVVGEVPGTSLAGRIVLVGAHYDHLGEGRFAPHSAAVPAGDDVIFNGADDNASGVSAVVEAARALVGTAPKRTIWFVAFGAEEEGLVGSNALFTRYPGLAAALDAVIVMDMVGAPGKASPYAPSYLNVEDVPSGGSRIARLVTDVVGPLASAGAVAFGQGAPFAGARVIPFEGRSDHEPFARANVQATLLCAATDEYPYYHTVQDSVDKLDVRMLETAARLATAAAYVAAEQPEQGALPRKKGDLNGDGAVSLADVTLCLQMVVGLRTPTLDDVSVGDVAPLGGDGRLTVQDVQALLRSAIGL